MTAATDQSTERQWAEDISPLCEVREIPMAEHTPGPWDVLPACNYVGYAIAPRGTLPTLAAVERPAGRKDTINVHAFNFPGQTLPNARLLASAPELLKALEATTRELIGERDCLYESVSLPDGSVPDGEDQAGLAEMDRVIDQARSAIKKARGEDQ